MIWTLVFIAIIANAARESRYRSRLSTWLVGIALFFGGVILTGILSNGLAALVLGLTGQSWGAGLVTGLVVTLVMLWPLNLIAKRVYRFPARHSSTEQPQLNSVR